MYQPVAPVVRVAPYVGATVIKANTFLASLACSGNTPAPTNAGQPNTAPSKTDQCAGL